MTNIISVVNMVKLTSSISSVLNGVSVAEAIVLNNTETEGGTE